MSYPRQLLRLRPAGGLALDLPAVEVGDNNYTGGSNVVFRDGFAERAGGSRTVYSQNTANPVFRLVNVRAPGGVTISNFWLAFGAASIDALETTNINSVTGAALTTAPAPWAICTTLLNNLPCFTNGLDIPRYWGGDVGVAFADLPGWPAGTICHNLVAFKYHLFALDIDGPSGHFESQIKWSDAAAPGAIPSTWVAAITNEAGDTLLGDTPGPCMCGVPLQDTLLIFKRSSLYGVNYIGGTFVYSTRLLDGSRGALTRHAAADVGGRVLVVTDGDVMLTDGTSWSTIALGRVRDYLFSQLDQTSYEQLYVVYHRAKNEAWICFPTTGSTYCDLAIIYNVATDGWGVRSLVDNTCAEVGIINDLAQDESWDADAGAWDADPSAWNSANFSLAVEQLVLGFNSALLSLQDDSTATGIAATLYKHDMAMGAPERVKFIRRIHARTNAVPGTLYLRVGSRASVTDSIAWGTEQTLTAPAGFVNVRAQGKLISVEVRSSVLDTDVWKLSGLDIEYELRGYR